MKHRPLTIISIILILVVGFSITPALADDEALGREAEQAGKLRQALTHYVSALQSTSEGSSKDRLLRGKIIKLAQKIQPPPAVPEEALRHMGRGQAAVEIAKGPEDYNQAITEFKKAVRLAPWLASGYFNLGVVQEKTGRFSDAMRSFKLYLLAAPNATDAQAVKTKIYGLEMKAEKQQENESAIEAKRRSERSAIEAKRQSEREEIKRQEKYAFLLGTWDMQRIDKKASIFGGRKYVDSWGTFSLSMQGNMMEGYRKITKIQLRGDDRIVSQPGYSEQVLRGTLKGSAPIEIRWEVKTDKIRRYCPEWGGWRTANILISANKKRISFRIPKGMMLAKGGCSDGGGYGEYILTR